MSLGVPLSGSEWDSTFLSGRPQYSAAALQLEMSLLKMWSMHFVMREVVEGEYAGIGSGRGEFGRPPDRLLHSSVNEHKLRQSRVLAKVSPTGKFWVEQIDWSKSAGIGTGDAD